MRTLIVSLVATLAATSAPLSAQCLLPDGLDGPCCAVATPNLPAFPAYLMQGVGFCYSACAPSANPCLLWDLQAPISTGCGQYTVDVRISECGVTPQLFGQLVLDYSRTWEEIAPTGTTLQVWRFLAKADLSLIPGTVANPCLVPPSALVFPSIFYYGHIDYALDCATGTWEVATVLMHQCDWFIHSPALSSQPGVFHPTRSYALVGPSTPANPFVPAIHTPVPGPAITAATRVQGGAAGLACLTREVMQGGFNNLTQACICPFSVALPQVTARNLQLVGTCGSAAASLNTLGFGFPWLHIMTTSIGNWTTTNTFPGDRIVWVDEGALLYNQACGGGAFFVDVAYGVTTAKGYPVLPNPAAPAGQTKTDLASNFTLPLGGPIVGPFVGNVLPTRHVLNVDLP